jgi:hypothetical protein
MKNLFLETRGIKGGNPKTTEKNGSVLAVFGNQRIYIDNFEGRGDSYKQRETLLIEITEEGKLLFSGTFEELKSKLI